MDNKLTKWIRLGYGIVLSVMCVISGLLLMAACLQIYQSGGEQVYTPEKVASAFAPIAMPVYITLGLIAGSFLLELILPLEKKRIPVQKQYGVMLKEQYEKIDLPLCNEELKARLKEEQNNRRMHLIISAALLAAGCVAFLIYALNGTHFDDHNINGSVINAMYWLLPCMTVPFIYCVFTAYYGRRSMQRELELAKLAPKAAKKAESAPAKPENKLLYVRLAVLVIALVCLVGGFIAGGTADVLAKAVAICTECVGLG